MSLGKKTVEGVIWNYVSFASGKFLTFISTIILARLLAPEQFGVVAIALLAIQYLDSIGDLGISEALIYQRENLTQARNVAFIISVVAGCGLAVVAYLLAPLVAGFYDEPTVMPMLQVLALTLAINGFGQTQLALLTKELRFRQKILPDLSRSLVKGVSSIALAALGMGAWSLVWGQVLGSLAITVVLWAISTWRPRLVWDAALARTMLGYGVQVVLIQMLSVLWATADYLIVGRLLGRADLALYQQAFRLSDLLIINIAFVVGRVLFPSYTKMNHDMDRLRAGFLTTIRYIALVTLPFSIGISAVAPDFVGLVFGAQWLGMIPALQLLALRAGVSTLSFNSGQLLKAIGRPEIVNYQTLAKLCVLVVVVLLTVPYGFVAVAAGQLGVSLFVLCIDYLTMRQMIGVSLGAIWQRIMPALIPAVAMGLTTWLIVAAIPAQWRLIGLAVAVVTGMIVYVGGLWLTDRALWLSALGWLNKVSGARFQRDSS